MADHGSTAVAALGTHVDEAVGHLDDVEVVLDDEHRVAGIDEALQHVEQLPHVLEVQARRGLVEDVEGLARLLAVQLLGELDALGLAAGERGGGLPQPDVAKAHVIERLQLVLDARDVAKESECLRDAHVEYLGDVLTVVGDLERLPVVARTVAHLAGNVDVRQEVHLDLDLAIAFAGLAAPARNVEAEAAGTVAARAALGRAGEQGAQIVPEADVGGRVGAWRAADGRLVHVDDLVNLVDAREPLVLPHRAHRVLDGVGERRRQRIGDERALARAGHARDHRERAELDAHRDVLEVVVRGARDLERAATRAAALPGQANEPLAREVGARDGVRVVHDLPRRASRDHLAAQLAGAGAHVNHVVGRTDGVLVVLDLDDGVALVAQALERVDEAVVVALVQANGGLVQDVEHAHEAGADLRGQADALGLAAGERGRRAREREVVEAHVHEEAQALDDLPDDAPADELLALRELELAEELERVPAAHAAHVVDGLAAHRHGQDLGLEAGAVAGGAWHLVDVLLEARPHVIVGGLVVLLEQDGAHASVGGEPVCVAAVDRVVVDANLGVAQAVEQGGAGALGQLAPRGLVAHLEVAADGGKDLRVVVGAPEEAAEHAVGHREVRVLDERLGIHHAAKAQAIAVRAGTVGGVEREVARLRVVHGVAMDGTGQGQGVLQHLVGHTLGVRAVGEQEHAHLARRELGCLLHGLGDAPERVLADDDAVDHDLDRVLELLVEPDLVVELADLAVDAHAREALGLEVLEELRVLALATHDHRRQHEGATPLSRREHLVGHLVGGLALDDATALRAVRRAHAREEQTQVVVYLGDRAHR